VPFTLTFDGTSAVFSAGGHTLSYVPTGTIEEIFVRTRAATANSSILVDNLVLNGEAVGATSQAVNASAGLAYEVVPRLGSSRASARSCHQGINCGMP
jgi:hypothetical protein